jgi:hypothetical protein
VIPSLHVRCKTTKIKQYFKENRALRTETTINDTYDFAIGRRLQIFPHGGTSAFPPTDVCSTFKPSVATVRSAKPASIQ